MKFSNGESPFGSGTCPLCIGIAGDHLRDPWNQPLLESQHFVVIPSLGALVEGWLLIVPKEHVLSVAKLSEARVEEMADVKHDVCEMVGRQYGSVRVFEHGPATPCSQTGCGVDHAHVHVVPLDVDLGNLAERFLPQGVTFQAGTMHDCRSAAARGFDYLFLEQPTGPSLVAVHDHFGSQVFRKAIAEACGTPGAYNWRDHPQLRNVGATIERLGERGAGRLSQVGARRAAAT
jgi:ATP adenylyltransferase